MRLMILSVFCMLILMANTCKKENNDCHHDLIIRNNAENTVVMAYRFYYGDLCVLQGVEIKAGNFYTEHSYTECWENRLSSSKIQEIFIVDPIKYNDPNVYYRCDSIEYYNTILKKYELTLEDLKQNNFTVNYP